jgi:RHS repeat-associated protein
MEAAFLDKGGKDGARLASTLAPVAPRGTPFTLMIAYDFDGHSRSLLYRIVTVIAALPHAPTDLAPESKDDSFSNVHGPVIDNHRSGGRLGRDCQWPLTRRDERERASQRLDMTTTSGSVYYHHDGLGNTIAITNGNAEVLERYSYDVFGRVTIVDASTGNSIPQSAHGVRHFYTGHDFQAELGLYLTHYRAYEPALGRWLSRDPIAESGGINLYAYVNGNPVNYYDPFGLDPITLQGIIKVDTDGSGPTHGNPYHQNETSLKIKGKSLNSDEIPFVVAPLNLLKEGVRPGDKAEISANGKKVKCVVGDFGPTKKGVGEASVKALKELGIDIKETKYGPIPVVNGSDADIPAEVTFHPSKAPKK